jgi:hypothetical protein
MLLFCGDDRLRFRPQPEPTSRCPFSGGHYGGQKEEEGCKEGSQEDCKEKEEVSAVGVSPPED